MTSTSHTEWTCRAGGHSGPRLQALLEDLSRDARERAQHGANAARQPLPSPVNTLQIGHNGRLSSWAGKHDQSAGPC